MEKIHENMHVLYMKACMFSCIFSIQCTVFPPSHRGGKGSITGCSCFCPLTGGLIRAACVYGCVVNGANYGSNMSYMYYIQIPPTYADAVGDVEEEQRRILGGLLDDIVACASHEDN